MIAELQRRGYDSDPVKAWARTQKDEAELNESKSDAESDAEGEAEADTTGDGCEICFFL